MGKFLKTQKTKIVDANGVPVTLKGVNLGGWLMMEGYILHSLNTAEQLFKRKFKRHLGEGELQLFEENFRKTFIQEKDLAVITNFGFNCIRVPFNYRLVKKDVFGYNKPGLAYLDGVIQWAEKYKLWVILDLHATFGAQNSDWHSDSLGKSELWHNVSFQEKTFELWGFLADRYKDNPAVAGYDLLNESVVEDAGLLNKFYRQLIQRIRRADPNHILFVEGNKWATDIKCLEEFNDGNIVLSIHTYQPADFVFNFVPSITYPCHYQGQPWDRNALKRILSDYHETSQKHNRPIFVGEFGVNNRFGHCGEDKWVEDMVSVFREFEFHWTYWTYKAVKNGILPDGIFSYEDNPPWVNRQGPVMGWDTYHLHWPQKKEQMIRSWDTGVFEKNAKIADILSRYAKAK